MLLERNISPYTTQRVLGLKLWCSDQVVYLSDALYTYIILACIIQGAFVETVMIVSYYSLYLYLFLTLFHCSSLCINMLIAICTLFLVISLVSA